MIAVFVTPIMGFRSLLQLLEECFLGLKEWKHGLVYDQNPSALLKDLVAVSKSSHRIVTVMKADVKNNEIEFLVAPIKVLSGAVMNHNLLAKLFCHKIDDFAEFGRRLDGMDFVTFRRQIDRGFSPAGSDIHRMIVWGTVRNGAAVPRFESLAVGRFMISLIAPP